MHWKTGPNGSQYLYATKSREERSLGPRSSETERIFEEHARRSDELSVRVKKSYEVILRTARVSKALYLGRLPTIAGRILRKLDELQLLDGALQVVGTNALFAYESATGVLFSDAIVATEDLDLLWDARSRLSLIVSASEESGFLSILRKVDRSFQLTRPYRASNDETYLVDLIRPPIPHEMFKPSPRLSDREGDFTPAPIDGLEWLINAPKLEDVVIAEDGMPVRMVTLDPRVFALHKVWLSGRPNRSALKRNRDRAQAKAVAEVAVQSLNLSFDDEALSALPLELMAGVQELQQSMAMVPQP